MRALSRRWCGFWFTPAAPTNLGVCRLLFFAVLLLRYRLVPIDPTDASAWAAVPQVFWMPTPLLGHFVLPILPASVLAWLEVLWSVALATSCIGLFTRLGTALAFLLGTYLLWLPHNFGKLHHMDGMVVLIVGILAASRCGDGWSIDAWIRQLRRGTEASAVRASLRGDYTWPIRVVWLVMAMVFLESGLAKLRYAGLAWAASDNLSNMLIKANYGAYTSIPLLTHWGLYLAQHRWLCRMLAATTLALEVGYPLVLCSSRLRAVWVPMMCVVVVAMFCLIVPAFVELIAAHVFWVPWDRVAARFHRAASPLSQ